MLTSSWFNLLLVCVPLGWAADLFNWGSVPVFAFNFTSLIPLALVLGQLTEDLALRYGEGDRERVGSWFLSFYSMREREREKRK